nr:zinc finger, CCHC-type, retrotransposon Gag domain protein [Tanacetum cinerariifolium]
MVNTRTDAELAAAVQNALQTLLPQIRTEIREEFRTESGPSGSGGNPPLVTIHTWLERFNKQKPRLFEKATAPVDAENWISHMEKIFDVMGCEDAFKTRLTVYKFEGDALAWWKSYKRNFVPTAVITNSSKVPVIAKQSSPRAATSTSTARYVHTATTRPTVNSAKPSSNVFHKSHSPVKRTFNQRTTLKNSDLKETINTAKAYTYYCQMKVNAAMHKLTTAGEVKTVNEDVQIRALEDGKKISMNEASIRRVLRLDDAEGTTCLPNAAIFEELTRMSAKTTAWNEFSSTVASVIICLANNKNSTFLRSTNPKGSRGRKLRFLTLSHKLRNIYLPLPMIHYLRQIKTNQAAKIEKLKQRVKKLEGKKKKRTRGLKRLYKGMMNDEDIFGVNDLDGDEVIVDVTAGKNVDQDAIVSKKEVSAAESVEGITSATTPQISKDDVRLAQTLIEIKAAKPKARGVTIQEPSITAATTPQISKDDVTLAQTLIEIKAAKPKARGVTIQEPKPEKPLKNKDYIALDEEVAIKLEAEIKAKMDKEERIARENNKENIAVIEEWDDVQATIDADRQLAEQLQAQEREQLSITERSKLLAELIKSRRKSEGRSKENSSRKLKRCLEIVPEDDDDVTIKATLLYSKSPTKVDYKIYKERKKTYFKIIRENGNSQKYLTFGTMFKNFNREDLEVLKSIMKERFKKTKPVNDVDNLLF